MKFKPLINNEAAYSGYTHRLDFSYKDIPSGIANNTSKLFNVAPLPVIPNHSIIYNALLILVTPFANTADTAFNSDTISLGDVGSATRFFSAVEVNLNGSYVNESFASAKNTVYTAADQLSITLNSMTAKSISNLNQGQIICLFRMGNTQRDKLIDSQGP